MPSCITSSKYGEGRHTHTEGERTGRTGETLRERGGKLRGSTKDEERIRTRREKAKREVRWESEKRKAKESSQQPTDHSEFMGIERALSKLQVRVGLRQLTSKAPHTLSHL